MSSVPRRGSYSEISTHIDKLLQVCQTDKDLADECFRFQFGHAAAKADFSRSQQLPELQRSHLRSTLFRMADFAAAAAKVLLRRVKAHATVSAAQQMEEMCATAWPGPERSGSVDDVEEGSEGWAEIGANIAYHSLQVLSLILVVDQEFRHDIQDHIVHEKGIIGYLDEALSIEREVELHYFAEGYRTMHVALIANLTYENSQCCKLVAQNETLMYTLLTSSPQIDEENPGVGEWADFALRNICVALGPDFVKSIRRPTVSNSV